MTMRCISMTIGRITMALLYGRMGMVGMMIGMWIQRTLFAIHWRHEFVIASSWRRRMFVRMMLRRSSVGVRWLLRVCRVLLLW